MTRDTRIADIDADLALVATWASTSPMILTLAEHCRYLLALVQSQAATIKTVDRMLAEEVAAGDEASRSAEARCAQLTAALEAAIGTIQIWHGMGMGAAEAESWALYQQSPEMKRLFAALASSPSREPEPQR